MQDEESRNTTASLRQPTALKDVKLPRSRIVSRNPALGRHPGPVVREELVKAFEGHEDHINFIAAFPDGTRIATASADNTIRIWRLEDGVEVMKWVVETSVSALTILRNGIHLVSSEGEHAYPPNLNKAGCQQLWVRDAETGSVVAGPLGGHTDTISLSTLDISPNDRILASGFQEVIVLWDTTNWQRRRDALTCGAPAFCIRFSPSGQLGVATSKEIQVWDLGRRERIATFNGHADFNRARNLLLTWTPDGVHLLSAGDVKDPVIRSWNTSTWKQVGDPWADNNVRISHITLNPTGTLLASVSDDRTVRLLQLPTGREVARYEHSSLVIRVVFSMDGRSLFGGCLDNKILQWDIPDDVFAVMHGVPLVEELKSKVTLLITASYITSSCASTLGWYSTEQT
jgi:WD40 repeat protein